MQHLRSNCSRRRLQAVCRAEDQADKKAWQSQLRYATGRGKQRVWKPQLDPPPLLSDVTVVIVSPRKPNTPGAVARSLSSFECTDLRLVAPRCNHVARSSRSSSKGAQWLLWRATLYDSLYEALVDTVPIAFDRWRVSQKPCAYEGLPDLLEGRELTEWFNSPLISTSKSKLALVFGREEAGLTPEEIDLCRATCSIRMGRLQESLSVGHAVSIALSHLFEKRLTHETEVSIPSSMLDLAEGCLCFGTEEEQEALRIQLEEVEKLHGISTN